jgi:hypothetical protein
MSRVGVASCHAAQRWCSPLAPAARRPAPSGTRGCAAQARAAAGAGARPFRSPIVAAQLAEALAGCHPESRLLTGGVVPSTATSSPTTSSSTQPRRRGAPVRSGSISGSSCSCLQRARLGRSGLTDESPRSSCSGCRKVLYILYFFSFDSTANGLTEKKVYPRHF